MPLLRESSRRLDVMPSFSAERAKERHQIVLFLVCQLERDNEIVFGQPGVSVPPTRWVLSSPAGGLVSSAGLKDVVAVGETGVAQGPRMVVDTLDASFY